MSNLKELIRHQLVLLETLKGQLENELHLISSRDAETLTSLLAKKTTTLDEIAQQDKLIADAYEKEYDEQNSQDVDELLEQTRALVEQCKYRTEINAKAVEQGQLRLEHLRNLLLEARSKESMTYDKSGKPKGGTSLKGVSA